MKTKELSLQKEISPIALKAKAIEVVDKYTLEEAIDHLGKAKNTLKQLTQDKKKMTDPINQSLKEIRLRYAPSEALLNEVIDTLTGKVSVYQTEITLKLEQEQKKIANKVSSGYIKPETAVDKLDNLSTVDKKVGNAVFIATPCFEVVDMALLPLEFHVADEVAIRKVMLLGNQLPGVKYWIEQRPRNM